ncbi:PKD domain-containing protein, partial [Bacteriovoracaceae bacterium]|nr:PKD domain-containing protein [Bacteriovoracaceae bacterium]
YMQAGTYEVTLFVVDAEGLIGSSTQTITVNEKSGNLGDPKAYFTFESVVDFDENNNAQTQLVLLFQGEAGDTPLASAEYEIIQAGQTFTPRDLYPATYTIIETLPAGIYDVRLTVTDEGGKSAGFTHNILLNGEDQSPYLRAQVIQSAPLTAFVNLLGSFDPIDNEFEFEIDWGDGNTTNLSREMGATHTYAAIGTYNVSVTSFSPNIGTQTTETYSVSVNNEDTQALYPSANFDRWFEDFAKHVRFYDDRSVTPNGDIISYHWNFGDGSEGSGKSVNHFYTPGVYLVTLTVTDTAGMRDSQTQRVVVTEAGPPLIVNAECEAFGKRVRCYAIALDDTGEIADVELDWGDGSDVTLIPAENGNWFEFEREYEYAADGTYEVIIGAFTLRGDDVFFSTSVEVGGSTGPQAPFADFFCSQDELVVSCSDNSFDNDGFITSVEANMGDGTVYSDIQSFWQHEYQDPGEYTITLTVTDNDLQTGAATQNVSVFGNINQVPQVAFNCTQDGLNLNCIDSSIDFDGDIVVREWSVNGEVQSSTENLNYTAAQKGNFEVTLRVTDNEDASEQASESYFLSDDVNDILVAEIICSEIDTLTLSCHSQSSSGVATSIKWTVNGEVAFSDKEIITLEYDEDTNLNINLELSNVLTSNSKSIDYSLAYQAPNSQFSVNFEENNFATIDATGSLSDGKFVRSWKLTVDGEEYTSLNGIFSLPSAGLSGKEVFVEVGDRFGAKSASSRIIGAEEINLYPDFEITWNQPFGRASLLVDFDVALIGIDNNEGNTYQWTIDGQTVDTSAATYRYSEVGDKAISLVVTNAQGNQATKSLDINIEKPIISANFNQEYYPMDNVLISFDNLIPETTGSLLINSGTTRILKNGLDDLSFVFPIATSGEEIQFDLTLDGHSFSQTLKTISYTLSANPVEEIARTKGIIAARIKEATKNNIDFDGYENSVNDLIDSVVSSLQAENDIELLQWGSLFLQKEVRTLNDSLIVKRNIRNNIFDSLMNLFVEKSYAVTHKELEDKADKCFKDIKDNKNYRKILSYIGFISDRPEGFAGDVIRTTILASAAVGKKAMIAFAVFTPIAQMISNVIAIGDHKRDLISCSGNVMYPINCSSSDIELSFDNVPKNDDGITTYSSGVAYDFNPSFLAGNYNFVAAKLESDSSCNESALGNTFREYKLGLTLYDTSRFDIRDAFNFESFNTEAKALDFIDKNGAIRELPSAEKTNIARSIVNGIFRVQSSLTENGVKVQLEEAIELLSNPSITPPESVRYTKRLNETDAKISRLAEGRIVNFDEDKFNFGTNLLTFHVTDDQFNLFVTFTDKDRSNIGHITTKFESTEPANGEKKTDSNSLAELRFTTSFNADQFCKDLPANASLVNFPNGSGVIRKDLSESIDSRSFISKNSAICNAAELSGFIKLDGNVIVDAPLARILSEDSVEFFNGEVKPDLEMTGIISIVEKEEKVLIDMRNYPRDLDDVNNSKYGRPIISTSTEV